MKRTKRIPDIICCTPLDDYTSIPFNMLLDEKISWKAKGLLCSLFMNPIDMHGNKASIEKYGREGLSSIGSGLQELEAAGYFLKIRYYKKEDPTKRIKGTAWVCTNIPGSFNWGLIGAYFQKEGVAPLDKEFQDFMNWAAGCQEVL